MAVALWERDRPGVAGRKMSGKNIYLSDGRRAYLSVR